MLLNARTLDYPIHLQMLSIWKVLHFQYFLGTFILYFAQEYVIKITVAILLWNSVY